MIELFELENCAPQNFEALHHSDALCGSLATANNSQIL